MKYTVLTYIFNGYERVHEIREKDPDASYVLVTDDPALRSDTWLVIYDPMPGLSPFDKCYEVRFHPFRYTDRDIVVRIDGSIEVKQSLAPLMDMFERGGYDRCMMIHPARNMMAEEYNVWVRTRKYPRSQAEKCMRLMQRLGYRLHSYRGLFQGCFEIVRRNEVNRQLNDLTFSLLRYLGEDGKIERIDQTVTTFVANHLFSDRMKVMPVTERLITDSDLMQWYLHRSNTRIPDAPKIAPMMFDEAVNPSTIFI